MLRVMSVVDGSGGIADLGHGSRCMEARRDMKENDSSDSHKFKIKNCQFGFFWNLVMHFFLLILFTALPSSYRLRDLRYDLAVPSARPQILLPALTGSQVEMLCCCLLFVLRISQMPHLPGPCLQLHHMVDGLEYLFFFRQ